MHYGWYIDIEELCNYARKHNLTQHRLQENLYDEDGNPISEEEEDDIGSANEALRDLVKHMGEAESPGEVKITGGAQFYTLVSLFTNYTPNQVPTSAFKWALQRTLQLREEPKWWIDGHVWCWKSEIRLAKSRREYLMNARAVRCHKGRPELPNMRCCSG